MVVPPLSARAGRRGGFAWGFRFFLPEAISGVGSRNLILAQPFSLPSLPKSHRLHHAEEFTAVIRFRCAVSGEFFQVYARPNSLAHPRLGLIVAGKVVRRAVGRNRVKRLLREVFRARQQDLAGLDLVVRLRRPPDAEASAETAASRMVAEAETLMIQLQRCRAES